MAALRRIMRAVDLHSRRLVEGCGLTGPQLATLREACLMGPRPASALARAVHLSGPTMTGILSRLERRGLVRRIRGDADRRTVLVHVTPLGLETLARAPSQLQDRFRQALTTLPEWERLAMLSNLQRIASLMDAEDLDAAPLLMSEHDVLAADEPDADRPDEASPSLPRSRSG
ncbi:MAG: MarR family winged helix-turn-helix transcriptional regulator [Planctomycetota bacterium]